MRFSVVLGAGLGLAVLASGELDVKPRTSADSDVTMSSCAGEPATIGGRPMA